jgi:NAD(P)-dependent dehydrogenase (short-subunit alcohol dehydrogenase family)
MQPQQTALITGASGGIGYELSKLFAADGYTLILVARSADKLKVLAATLSARHGARVRVEPADLSKPGAAETLAARLKRARVPVDVLVNNAGVLAQGRFAAMSAASHQQAQGVTQVSTAIQQMEKVTQTTAATAEESAAVSQELNAQAETTLQVVRQMEELIVGTRAGATEGRATPVTNRRGVPGTHDLARLRDAA